MAADALFGQDGTQDPPPPPLAPDPLAGLVTGQLIGGFDQDVTPVPKVVPATPPKPDERAIRQAVDAALANERGRQPATRSAPARRVARPAPVVPRSTIGPRGPGGSAETSSVARARANTAPRGRGSTGVGCAFLVILVLAIIVFLAVQGGNLSGLFG